MKKLNLNAFVAMQLEETQQTEVKGGLSVIQVGRRQVKFSKWGEIDIRFDSNGLVVSKFTEITEDQD